MLCKRKNDRKLPQHGETEFSNASILNSMERFVRTVREMEETILIPTRLLDLTVGDQADKLQCEGERGIIIKTTLANENLYQLFNIISQVKVELLWSQDQMNRVQDLEENLESTESLGYSRCFSTTSIHSVRSTCTSIDSESDSIDNDSEFENEDSANAIATSFKRHLRKLHRNIEKMTCAAEYLTQRYQTDVERQT